MSRRAWTQSARRRQQRGANDLQDRPPLYTEVLHMQPDFFVADLLRKEVISLDRAGRCIPERRPSEADSSRRHERHEDSRSLLKYCSSRAFVSFVMVPLRAS